MPILKMQPQWGLGGNVRIVNKTIGDSDDGNLQTVDVMSNLARQRSTHPTVRQLALNILQSSGITSHNFLDEAKALATFVQENVRYVRDPNGVEQLQDPILMIQNTVQGTAQGDCDDQALLLSTLLLTVGAQPYYAIVRYKGTQGAYNHIYTVVYDRNIFGEKTRLPMDTIVKHRPIGFEVNYKSIREIPV